MNVVPPNLVRLCHRKWSLPVLARIDPDAGARFAPLAHILGASRRGGQTLYDRLAGAVVRRHLGSG